MTEQLFPDDQADGVVDGTLADVPASLQGVAGVLGAARAEATADELSGMAAAVHQFAAAVSTPETARSRSMFSYRLTKRSAAVIFATLLTAGTAAAAAGGVLSPSSDDPIAIDETSTTESTVDGTTTEAPGDTTTTEVPVHTSTTDVATTTGDDEDDDGRGPDASGPAAKGLCTAWTNGAPKNTSNPAFGALQEAAEQAGLTIDEYCAQVLADHDGDDDADDDEADDDQADHDDSDADDDDQGKGGDNGKGGGKGKSEDQHGNSGNHG